MKNSARGELVEPCEFCVSVVKLLYEPGPELLTLACYVELCKKGSNVGVNYQFQINYIRFVGTHTAYDRVNAEEI